jgi:ubiquinone/menaquinone biosynthesis C-methylase UbiE
MDSDEKKKSYYDSIYERKGDGAMRPDWVYRDWFKLLQPVERGKKLVDIGCGTGLLLKTAADAGLVTSGLDLSDAAVKVSRKNSPTSEVVQGEGEHLPFGDGVFDYVCCIGSLEHYADLPKGLAELKRVGKDAAKFLVVVPNDNYLFWRFKKIKKGTAQRAFEVLRDLDGWTRFFHAGGFAITGVRQDKYPMKELRIFQYFNPYKIIRRVLYKLIWMFMPLRSTYQFVFLLTKRDS